LQRVTARTLLAMFTAEFTHPPCDQALDEANANRWTVVDMKRDWKRIFPFKEGSTGSPAMGAMR